MILKTSTTMPQSGIFKERSRLVVDHDEAERKLVSLHP